MKPVRNIEYQIGVMKAWRDGQLIEIWKGDPINPWGFLERFENTDGNYQWDWHSQDYRVREPNEPDSIDWSHLKDEFISVARNNDGSAHAFTEEPSVVWEDWRGASGLKGVNVGAMASYKAGCVYWKKSLIKRPASSIHNVTVDGKDSGLKVETFANGKTRFVVTNDFDIKPSQDFVNWSSVDSRYNFIARDKSGAAFGYSDRPRLTSGGYWVSPRGSIGIIRTQGTGFQNLGRDYRESVISRPAPCGN